MPRPASTSTHSWTPRADGAGAAGTGTSTRDPELTAPAAHAESVGADVEELVGGHRAERSADRMGRGYDAVPCRPEKAARSLPVTGAARRTLTARERPVPQPPAVLGPRLRARPPRAPERGSMPSGAAPSAPACSRPSSPSSPAPATPDGAGRGAPGRVRRRPRAVLRRRWRQPRPRHPRGHPLVGGGAASPPAPASTPSSGSTRARPTPPSARCGRPATTPLPARAMGFCLFNNVAVRRGRPRRPGRAGADRRLRRPPRQRHAGHLLRRPAVLLRVDARVAAVSGHRLARRDRAGRGRGHHLNFPLPAGATGDVYLAAHRRRGRPRRRGVRADLGARLGRLRRPPRRPAHRPRPHARRLRRPHRPAVALVPPGPARRVPRGRLRPRGRWPTRPGATRRGAARRALRPEPPTSGGPGAHVSTPRS